MITEKILLSDFDYDLPEEKIAQIPLAERDSSKLLFYNRGRIIDEQFKDLPNIIDPDSSLFFNDTRVVNARLLVNRESGALIEILLIEPYQPAEVLQAMTTRNNCTWKCLIGNLKKWKGEPLKLNFAINNVSNTLIFNLLDREKGLVEFRWQHEVSFSEVLNHAGNLPLPPYLNRQFTDNDKIKYQTVYALNQGGVAAPTAGLHFTPASLDQMVQKSIQTNFLTLHVSAGTFQPVTVENIIDHPIHLEEIIVTKKNIESLLSNKEVIAVGTTSMRTLESIYWYGVKILSNNDDDFFIAKELPYQKIHNISLDESLKAVLDIFENKNSEMLTGRTEIFIYPGYEFKICKGLITNFHLPKSSLLMLVSAFIGEDWKLVYKHALDKGYRFLSYGDCSLLLPKT